MSVQAMGAVIECGPQDRTQFCVLMTLANYADELGFCYPQISTIAANARCDYKTTTRQIAELEAEGWLYVARKVLNGKSNVYILNLAKLGVTVPVDAKKNPVFMRLLKTSTVAMTPIFASKKSTGAGPFSTDNPQPPQRASGKSQRAKEGGSTGIACPPNRYNHQSRNHQEPSGEVESPPTPEGVGIAISAEAEESAPDELDDELPWSGFKRALKLDLASQPNHPNFRSISPGESDYDHAFRDWWFVSLRPDGDGAVFVTAARDPTETRVGVAKYKRRIERLLCEYFPVRETATIRFEYAEEKPC